MADIHNETFNTLVSGTDDVDYIDNWGDSVTIDGGTGDDTISLSNDGKNNLIVYNEGDGNDYIYGFKETSTLQIGGGSGTYSSQQSGSDIIVTVGDGKITLQGAANLSKVNIAGSYVNPLLITGTNGADTIRNSLEGATINALGGNDYISNIFDNASIDAGMGNDTIYNDASNVKINLGEGNDSIHNDTMLLDGNMGSQNPGDYVTIDGGKGNDTITSCGANNVSINGGDGNDVINGDLRSSTTVMGGKGNDTIELYSTGKNRLIQYTAGDDNDVILYFGATDTLQIGGGTGTYSSQVSGSDIIITVGDGNITLVGAANLSAINISGEYKPSLLITGTAGADTISNSLDGATINALGGDDYIQNGGYWYEGSTFTQHDGGSNVIINTSNGNDSVDNFYSSNVTINMGAGHDSVYNAYSSNVTINTGDGNDSVYNRYEGSNVKINTGAGNDSVYNELSSVTINTGEGHDYVSNWKSSVTIDTGAGDDSVSNSSDSVTINTGEGNDSIFNFGSSVTIEGGAGNDTINNNYDILIGSSHDNDNGSNILLKYSSGDGNDIIYGFKANSTLQIGGGSATYSTTKSGSDIIVTVGDGKITLSGASSLSAVNIAGVYNNPLLITGTEGADTIRNSLEGATINALGGNDYITNTAKNVSINAGAGNNTIQNSNANTTILALGGSDLITVVGEKVSVNSGAGNDYIVNEGSYVTIDSGAGDDSIKNGFQNLERSTTILAGDGNDSIINNYSNASIDGGAGSDYIENIIGSKVSINGGVGNDYIRNAGQSSTINGGDGADTISNDSSKVSINGGAGNDSIINSGQSLTVSGGTGNDTITNNYDGSSGGTNGHNVIFVYSSGDGNDIIYGFKANSTLEIGGGTGSYSSTKSGSDIIVTVGDGKITLVGAASLSTVNIAGKGDEKNSWKLSGTKATYGTSSKTLVTVNGVKALSGLSLSGKVVTVATSALNQSNVTVSDGYTLALADDVTQSSTKKTRSLSNSTATYKQTTTAGYTLASDAKSISYTAAATKTLTTLSNIKTLGGLSLSGTTITVAASSLNQKNVTVTNGYTLALADDVTTTSTNKAWSLSGTTATYKQTTSAGYTLASDAKSISYTKKATKTLATVNGVKALNGLSVKGKVVTVAASSLNQGNVTVSDGYTLALADDVTTTSTNKAWSLSNSTATYKQTTSAGYTLASDGMSINYTKKATKTLATVTGVKETSGLSVSGKVVTVAASSLNAKKVTVSDGYTLDLADDVSKTSTKKAWSLDKTTATYKQTTAEGYTLASDAKSITYTKKATKDLVTVTGVKATKGLSLSGKVVTVAASALNKGKVTVSDDYTLKLASGVTKTSTKKTWSINKTTATYKQTTTAGYALASDGKSISYTAANNTSATIKGLKSGLKVSNGKISGISLSGKKITLSKKVLGTSDVTVSKGYTLDLASDVTKASTNKAWSLNKTTATYKQTTSTGYTLASDAQSISYTKKASKTLATVNGAKSAKGFKLSGETIQLATNSLSNKVSVSSDDYGFEFAADYKKATITGSGSDDTITSSGQKITINSGAGNDSIVNKGKSSTINAGAGNDTIVNSGADVTIRGGKGNDYLTGGSGKDVFVYASGDGNDVITNYDTSDRISIESGAVDISTSGKNVIFTVGTGKNQGKITVQNAKSKAITYFVGEEERSYPDGDVKYNATGTAATLKVTYTKDNFEPSNYSDYVNSLVTINAAAVKHSLKITGNKQENEITGTNDNDSIYGGAGGDAILGSNGNDKLYGEAGNDSLVGGKGDDSLWGGVDSDTLTGGEGKDTFCYNKGDGNDVITDYSPSLDKVMILSSKVGSVLAVKDDVVFKIGNGQILFQNSSDKYIELVDKEGNVLKQYNPNS